MKVGDLVLIPDNLVRPALVIDIIKESTGATRLKGAWGEALIMFQRTGYKMWVDNDKLKVIS